jgi:ESS family glutamate:Na+ symporter
MCLLGAIVTERAIRYVTPRVFTDHPFERYVGVYGEMTGTIASGLALVRVTDPELATPVAQDLGLGSGMALLFGFPLLVVINLPYARFDGQLYGYWIVMGICLVYLALIVVIWKRFGLNFNKPDGGDD